MEVTRSNEMIRVVHIGLFVITNMMNNIDVDLIQTFMKRSKMKTKRLWRFVSMITAFW